MAKRIMGIDYGLVRTGVAVSDEMHFLASAVGTVKTTDENELIEKLTEYIRQYDVEKVVFGDPINMNGTVGTSSLRARAVADKLAAACGIEVVMLDERCTTMTAHNILNLTDTCGKKRKNTIDSLSAEIILQNYLDRIH